MSYTAIERKAGIEVSIVLQLIYKGFGLSQTHWPKEIQDFAAILEKKISDKAFEDFATEVGSLAVLPFAELYAFRRSLISGASNSNVLRFLDFIEQLARWLFPLQLLACVEDKRLQKLFEFSSPELFAEAAFEEFAFIGFHRPTLFNVMMAAFLREGMLKPSILPLLSTANQLFVGIFVEALQIGNQEEAILTGPGISLREFTASLARTDMETNLVGMVEASEMSEASKRSLVSCILEERAWERRKYAVAAWMGDESARPTEVAATAKLSASMPWLYSHQRSELSRRGAEKLKRYAETYLET